MIIACVRTGQRYPFAYVTKLRDMVARHMPPISYAFACLTDQPEEAAGVNRIDISGAQLEGWWAKMLLFQDGWRRGHRVIYLDLDTVITGDLSPLVGAVVKQFGICSNFARAAGNTGWPCRYGSCVMVLHSTFDDRIWRAFSPSRRQAMKDNEVYGDQRVIEQIYPNATILQDVLPANYMRSYRTLTAKPQPETAIINFGGKSKPHNCNIDWVRSQWA
jgi:hypothetical protein